MMKILYPEKKISIGKPRVEYGAIENKINIRNTMSIHVQKHNNRNRNCSENKI